MTGKAGTPNREAHHTESRQAIQPELYRLSSMPPGNSKNWPIYPHGVECVIRRKTRWFRENPSKFIMVIVVLEGSMQYKVRNTSYPLSPQMGLFMPAGEDYCFSSERTGFYHKVVLEIAGTHISSVAQSMGLTKPMMLEIEKMTGMVELIKKVNHMMEAQEDRLIPEILGCTYQILSMISVWLNVPVEPSSIIHKVQQRLEKVYGAHDSIRDIASEEGMSISTIDRLFRKEFHMTPNRYRTVCKMEVAQRLLKETMLSVKEIAARLGFCSQFHFSSQFNNYAGCSPIAYRKKSIVM